MYIIGCKAVFVMSIPILNGRKSRPIFIATYERYYPNHRLERKDSAHTW